MKPNGKLDYKVEKIYDYYYDLTFYIKYSDDEKRHAIFCNSDGSPNRWSGRLYHADLISYGGGEPTINIYGDDGIEYHLNIEDGPFYDY